MKLIDEIKVATKTLIKMKTEMCKAHNGPYDLVPMLHFKYSHLNGYCGVILAGGHPTQTIPVAWEQIIQDGIPEFVMILTEAYARTSKKPPKDYKRGEMEKDFKSNFDSDVKEILNIHAIDMKTGNQASSIVSFHYNDNGQPVFEEPSYSDCEGEALNANIPTLFSACREATLKIHKKAI